MDAQTGPPRHDDQSAHPPAVTAVPRLAHDRDDLDDGGRVSRVAVTLVPGTAPGVVPGHRRRRPTTAGGRPTTDEQTWLPPLESGQVSCLL